MWRLPGLRGRLPDHPTLAQVRKEFAEQRSAFSLRNTGNDLGPVMYLWVLENSGSLLDATRFWIGGTVKQPCDARRRYRRRAHRARFQSDCDGAANKPLAAERSAGCTNGEHFGMGGRVSPFTRAVAGTREQYSRGGGHYRADGDFPPTKRGASFRERQVDLWDKAAHHKELACPARRDQPESLCARRPDRSD